MTTTASAHRRRIGPAGPRRSPPVVGGVGHRDDAKRTSSPCMRTAEALFFTTLQPIMFTLLFTYVFGGAIHVPAATTSSS